MTTTSRPTRTRHAAGALALSLMGAGALVALAPTAAMGDPGQGSIRGAHLVPGLGAMEVDAYAGRVDPTSTDAEPMVVSAGLGYGEVTDYTAVPAGEYTVAIRNPADDSVVLTGVLGVGAQSTSTVAALGTTAEASIRAIPDDLSAPEPGKARVRLINAVEGAAPISVAAKDGPALATDLAFATPTDYADVNAGSWPLSVSGAATGTSSLQLAADTTSTVLVLSSPQGATTRTIVDAAGAQATPSGAIQTGGGGSAELAASRSGASEQGASRSYEGADAGAQIFPALAAGLALIGAGLYLATLKRPGAIAAAQKR